MAAFIDAEYEAGVYRDYVNARELKLATMRRRLPPVRAHANGLRLLDVGCGSGLFLEAALEDGFDPAGIELSPVAIELAQPTVRGRIIRGDVNTILATHPRRVDVVTAFDIIEHTFDPLSFLDDIGRVLVPGGLLVLSTPDTGHWLRPLMRSRWPMLQPDQHTFLFSRAAMRSMLMARGYEPIAIETAHKVLTIDYLFGQLRQTNPTLARVLDRAKRILPASVRHREITLNIGEMFVYARKRPSA
jgi:2-polyprenyl-3-methyl-5-hydroxy-6-metoxy-1,4-benzoquinol methylase